MLTEEVNDRYTRVGPGTPMGELMRRYWHPIAAVSQMRDKHTKKVRLLGEVGIEQVIVERFTRAFAQHPL